MQINRKSESAANLLLYLAILTAFFILMEVSFLIQCNTVYIQEFHQITSQLSLPRSILPGIILFIVIQLFIHLFYLLLVFCSSFFCGKLLRLSGNQTFTLALTMWFIGVTAALSANHYYFPHSNYSHLFSLILPDGILNWYLTVALSAVFFSIVCAGTIGFLVWLTDLSLNYSLLLLLISSAAIWIGVSKHASMPLIAATKHQQPNVIIIGIDSLRPDYLSYFGSHLSTPFLDSVLRESTVFNQAVTPLARTFPSWSTILTGEYPRQSGIRTNLMKVDHIDLSQTLPAIFSQHGYDTVYATDETRFSNINKAFGFNQIIAPPVGLNDFILGTLNDFPFSNLLVNTTLGYWLFPHSYANRPARATYDPDTFLRLIARKLQINSAQPLFMAVHFCLPHFPYEFAETNAREQTPQLNYQDSIRRVDRQVSDFVAYLKQQQLLDHAIVVLLSDHGEALELSGDRVTDQKHYITTGSKNTNIPHFYPPSLDEEAVNQSGGHGTDVLSLTQYRTVLAYRLFGMGAQRAGEVGGVVSLNQIKASLLALAGISNSDTPDTLAAIVRGKQQSLPLQHVFLESDFSPASIRSVYPDVRQAMLDGLSIFEVDPVTAQLSVKPDMQAMITRSKQYADIYGNWILALYPQPDNNFKPILVNLSTGQWTDEMSSSFAKHSPVHLMMSKLTTFFAIKHPPII